MNTYNIEPINVFFRNATELKTFCRIAPAQRTFLYQVALYCDAHNIGKVSTANKILEHYKHCEIRDNTQLPYVLSNIINEYAAGVEPKIFSTKSAFALLKEDGSVVTWGDPYRGGDSSMVQEKL